jgi:glycolate oxidase
MIEFLDKGLSEKLGFEEGYHLIVEYENDSGKLKGDSYRKLLAKRDEVYPLIATEGFVRIEDPKIMLDKFPTLMRWLEQKKVPVFGHIGVGILHPCFNIVQEKDIPELMKLVKRLSGQVSGEHGIGILKKAFVEFNDKKILENIKKRTDTLSKFNIGKVI